MRRLLLLLLLGATAAAQEREESAEKRVFLELFAPRESYFVQEPVRIELRVGFDQSYFETNVVPLFGRRMDLPVHVRAPWFESAAAPETERGSLSFALNDEVIEAARADDRRVDGRPFTVLTIERTYLPTRAGEIVIPAPTLRYAYATKFEEDFINGRRPLDRRDAVVTGEPLTIGIRALPEEGRPAEFTGAVGRFTVEADAEPRDIEVGEHTKLVLRIAGDGNLEHFDSPRLLGLDGFHVYGTIDDRGLAIRTVIYDLAPTRVVAELPPIPFVFFDPHPPARYRTVETRPIPLEVEPGPGGEPRAPAPEEPGAAHSLLLRTLVAALVLALLCAVGLLLRRRARGRAESDPERTRARGAAAAFLAVVDEPGTNLETAFAEFLAAQLSCEAAAVISPDLKARLAAAGFPAELAARAARLLEDLVGERYGGAEAGNAQAAARSVAEEVQARNRAE